MKRRIIRWLQPSTADLKALLVERLPSPQTKHNVYIHQLDAQDALLHLRDTLAAQAYTTRS